MKKIWTLLLILSAALPATAQTPLTIPENGYDAALAMTAEEYLNLKLPPLYVLIENARHAPMMRYYAANIEVEERELKTIRREWLTHIKGNASYTYGNIDSYSQQLFQNNPMVVAGNYAQEQSYWSVGGSVSLPLEAIFNRRNKIKKQRREIEAKEMEWEHYFAELRMRIVEAYTDAMRHMSELAIAVEDQTFADGQATMAENDFLNGKIDFSSLSQYKGIKADADRSYELARGLLLKSLLHLEVLTDTPIVSTGTAGTGK